MDRDQGTAVGKGIRARVQVATRRSTDADRCAYELSLAAYRLSHKDSGPVTMIPRATFTRLSPLPALGEVEDIDRLALEESETLLVGNAHRED